MKINYEYLIKLIILCRNNVQIFLVYYDRNTKGIPIIEIDEIAINAKTFNWKASNSPS